MAQPDTVPGSANHELVEAVLAELSRRNRNRWKRRLKFLAQVIVFIAALATIVSTLRAFGLF